MTRWRLGQLGFWAGCVRAVLIALVLLIAAPAVHAAPKLLQKHAFDVQFARPFNFARKVDLIELDGFDTSPARIQELRARGVVTICYINAGAWENWRPDSRDYPAEVIGRDYDGWIGERWLDIRRLDALRPILAKRIDLCRNKGFDAIDFDNVDGHTNRTGFNLTAEDQLAFNRWLAREARKRGLLVGLKNDLEQVDELVDDFDFAIVESCFELGECDRLRPFQEAGKPVYAIEYTNVKRKMDAYCALAQRKGLQVIFKTKSLNGKLHRRCPD